jgi:retron-type reverse transcriptase
MNTKELGTFCVASPSKYSDLRVVIPKIPSYNDPKVSFVLVKRANRYLAHQERRLQSAIRAGQLETALKIFTTLVQRSYSFQISFINRHVKGWYWTLSHESLFKLFHNIREKAKKLDGNLIYKRTYIPKGDGRVRPLGVPSVDDRVINSMWAWFLSTLIDPLLPDSQHGFRKKRGVWSAWAEILLLSSKFKFAYEFDLKGFFNNISPRYVDQVLGIAGFPPEMRSYISRVNHMFPLMDTNELIEEAEVQKYYLDGREVYRKSGLPQGLPWSPTLSMFALAYAFRNINQGQLVMYADDGILFTNNMNDIRELRTDEAINNGIVIADKLKKDGTPSSGFIRDIVKFLGHEYSMKDKTLLLNGAWIPIESIDEKEYKTIFGKTKYSDAPIKDWRWFINVDSWMYKHTHVFKPENLKYGLKKMIDWILGKPKTVEQSWLKFFHIMKQSTICSEYYLHRMKPRALRTKIRNFMAIYGDKDDRILYSIQDIYPLDKKYLTKAKNPTLCSIIKRQSLLTHFYGGSTLKTSGFKWR